MVQNVIIQNPKNCTTLHRGTTAMLRAIEKTDVLRPVLQNFFTVTNIFTTLV